MADVSTRMVGEMAGNIERLLSSEPAEPAPASDAGLHGSTSDADRSLVSSEDRGGLHHAPAQAHAVPSPPPASSSEVKLLAIVAAILRGRWAAVRGWLRRRRAGAA
jgi:hypothetical protein